VSASLWLAVVVATSAVAAGIFALAVVFRFDTILGKYYTCRTRFDW
jgi:hypothetical protein